MEKIRVAIVGYGNIGQAALEAVQAAPDMECAGIVRRNASKEGFPELSALPVVSDVRELGKVDVAILATPSRKVEETALKYLALGINTVDNGQWSTVNGQCSTDNGQWSMDNKAYDLQGRRILRQPKRGVYIRNGQKILN